MPLRPPAGFIRPGYDPLKNPDAPTNVSASGGDATASVSFTPPVNVGGSAVSAYYAVSNPSQITVSGTSSPITVTGLTNGTSYTFTVWALNTYGPSAYSAASDSVTPSAPTAVFAGGTIFSGGSTATNVIQYRTIASTGNTSDFGDLSLARNRLSGCGGGNSRAVFVGGKESQFFTRVNVIDYINIASTGNATDFGDLITALESIGACSNSVRGVFGGGASTTNVIQYITFATLGNATDFGDLLNPTENLAGCSSPTRGLFMAGDTSIGINVIQYITIASTGNATDFGDLTVAVYSNAACSSSTRGICAGGYSSQSENTISYVTIASTGNATDFGDLTAGRDGLAGCSSNTRGLFGGGNVSGSLSNIIDYITIASTSNATDFGDLIAQTAALAAASNAHGGLQ